MSENRSVSFTEFDLIKTFFSSEFKDSPSDLLLGIGDDAAIFHPYQSKVKIASHTICAEDKYDKLPDAKQTALTLISLPYNQLTEAQITVQGFSLALTLPEIDHVWLKVFSKTLKKFAQNKHFSLFGGDTTQGDWAFTVVLHGYAKDGH